MIKSVFLIIFLFLTAIGTKVFAQFNPGKIAVLVVGDGTSYAAGTAAPVFVKEFNVSGTGQTGTVRTSLPATAVGGTTAVNRALTQNISSVSEGVINLSTNRQFLTVTGYNVTAGTASVTSSSSATFPTNTRVVGKIGVDGIADTRTTLHTFLNSGTRGAVTVDGTAYWLSLAAGVSYVPDANVTNSVVNLNSTLVRGIGIFNNQLYTSAASGSIRLAQVGSGLPTTTGQTLTNLPGYPTTATDPYGFVFLNTDASAGPDVVYVASSNAAPAGIVKYTSSDQGATWVSNGFLSGFGIGVTAVYNSCTGNADLYILSSTAANVKPTFLYKYTDVAAASSTLSLAINSGTLLATAAANTSFGGVAFTPGSTLIAPAMYSVTGGNGCTSTGVNIGLSNSETGVSYQLFNGGVPVGSPVNGSGSAISFGNQSAVGTYTIVATNLLSGCTANMNGNVDINLSPTVIFTGLQASYCNNAPSVTLTGSPAGGTFSGPGISGNIFDPATAGAGGPYTIIYIYTDVNGCSNSSSQTVTVNALPIVSFTGLQASYCNDAPAVTLTGSPAGGTFSGPGISGNTFDPATAGAGGPYTITYSYTDGNGCSNISSQTVSVSVTPAITGTMPATRCGAGTVVLGATGTGTGIAWYGSATGNDYLGSGNSFTTPLISATTQFYAAAMNGLGILSGLGNTSLPPDNSGWLALRGIVFNANQAFTLASAQYYSSATNVTNTVTVVLQDNSGTTLQTANLSIVQGASPGWYTMNLNFSINPGNGYRLLAFFTETVHRDLSANYALPAYNNLGAAGIITSGWENGVSASTYNYFHNLSIYSFCNSARTAVTATVTPSPAITLNVTSTAICNGNSTGLSVSSSNDPNYTYTWSSVPAGFSQTGSGPFTVSPATTTTYNVYALDNTTGNLNSGCGALTSATVNVVANNLNITATATPSILCSGGNSQLVASVAYCQAGAIFNFCESGDEYISNVSFNTINNTSTCPPSGQYSDFTAISTNISAGSDYTASVLNPNWYSGDRAAVWIDFNQNNTFDDPGEFFALTTGGGNGTTPLSGLINIPLAAANGPTRMRVRYSYNEAFTPCGNTAFGETEDYTVNISGGTGTTISYTFDWSSNPTFLSATNISNPQVTGITADQTYTVSVTDQLYGCAKTASVNITVSIPTAVITAGITCSNGSIQLNAIATAGNGGTSITGYQWLLDGNPIVGAVTATYEATAAGSYTVTVTNNLGCSVTSEPYIISVINSALNGTYTINSSLPASCNNYVSMAAATSDLNAKGVSGHVLFNVASGHIETAPAGGLVINYCALNAALMPSATQTVTFQGGTVAAVITAQVGTSTSVDGIIKLVGADYITFNKIDLQESAANVDATTQMEWGYALLKCDGNNGSGHNTISNCSVTLNKANQLSRGIYSGNHTGAGLANLTYTGTAGDAIQVDSSRNGYNSFFSNSIQNVYSAIALSGNTATSGTLSLNDTMNVVGNTGQGNTITDYGGSSAAAIAINLSGQRNTKVIGNSISGGVGNTNTVTGIQLQSGLWAEVKDNTVSLSSNATASTVIGITCALSGGSVAFPNTVMITGNTIQGINYATATTGQLIGLTSSSGGTGSSITISNNTVQNNTLTGTGTLNGITNTATSGTLVMNNNEVFGNVKSGTGTMTLLDAGSMGTTNTTTISYNTVWDNQITGASGIMNCTKAGSSQVTFTGNLVYNNSIPNTSGATASSMYGYINGASPTVDNLTYNNVYNLSIGGAGTSTGHLIYGLYTFSISGTVKDITGNAIHDLSMAPAGNIRGIFHDAGSTVDINRNKIYGLSSTSASASVLVEGIRINSGINTRVYNNIIGNLSASSSTSADAIRAISSYTVTANSTIGLYFNSIYLSGTSTGTNFGSTGIFHTTSTTATTASLDMRNNIVVNNCTPTGTGRAVAYRRSNTDLANFAASSNNNIYFVSTGANNHIYSDGTNHLGMTAYKAFAGISPRETSSQQENVAFFSTTGSDAEFLQLFTNIPTAAERGGQPISGITVDFSLISRNTLVPDIGAYEDDYTGEFPVFVSLSASPATPQCVATTRTITATIDYSNTPYLVNAKLNYSWNGVPQTAINMFFDYGAPLGTATATLPAPPSNVLVSWSVTITDNVTYTQTATGASFTDAYLTGFSVSASADQPNLCTGSPVVLTGVINGPVPVAPAASSYCASTHISGCSGDEITNVTLGTINNATSGCGGASHYTYFNGGGTQTTSLAANVSHTLSVSFGAHTIQYFGAWIDYDHNGTYDASEFLGASGNAGANGTTSVIFTIPETAYNGLTHMRIVGGNDAVVSATQACGASSSIWGETQDYDVTITGAEPGFVLPVTYSWKDAGNNIISTVNQATFTPSATSSYTLTVSDANGCSLVSSPVFVTVSPMLSYNISGNLEFCEGGSTTLTVGPLPVRYANSVIAFSSEYSPSPGGWSAAAALGIQDVYPAYGDISNSWASADADNQREYLVLGFADAAPVNFIDIYETYKPGSVDTVYVKNPITGLFEIVYTTTASIQPDVARKLHITFPLTAFPVSEIRIAMNSPAVPDWNEIDAVAIGNRSILWSTGETTESIVVTASGNYSVTVSNGCTASASVSVVETSLDFVNLQWPPIASVCQGADFTAYGLVGEAGVTGTYGVPGPGITAEFGYSTSNTDPSTWTNWVPATFNALATWQPADEYFANFGSTLAPGIYYYTFRYTLNGCGYQYGGYSVGGGGTWDGINYLNGTLTVNVCSPNTTLNLTAFLEGFYSDINTMRANIYDLGISTNPTETDTVTVNLWSTASLSNPEPDHSIQAVIHTDGTASMQFPAGVAGNEYYIAVKHRNHLETWSKLPVMFTSTTAYDFSSAMAQAYDDGVNPPMASVAGGKFAFYGGDVNQDGGIDASDQGDVDNDVSLFAFGYNTTDATGDGSTDASDMQVVDNNLPLFLFYARPY